MDDLSQDQVLREKALRELGEVMLAIEVASNRVEKAIIVLSGDEFSGDPAIAALKETQRKLESARRTLHQKGYLSGPQLSLF
jgi:site-specific recombinase